MMMSRTCLNLHSAADFTRTHVTVCSYREFVGFPTMQVGELAGGVGGVALQNHSHTVGGSSYVKLHSVSFLPVYVGRTRPTLQVHSNMQRFTRCWTRCLNEFSFNIFRWSSLYLRLWLFSSQETNYKIV